jgi:hypothetical protein
MIHNIHLSKIYKNNKIIRSEDKLVINLNIHREKKLNKILFLI